MGVEAFQSERGFLPAADPCVRLPREFEAWEQVAAELPKLLAAGCVRKSLRELPRLDVAPLHDEPLIRRAMMLLSYFGHAYVWGEAEPVRAIPAMIAVPWHAAAERVGRPPVLSYASYALDNWRRLKPDGPVALGNIALLQNFLAGEDEEWFILVHVEIEAIVGAALGAIPAAQKAAGENNPDALAAHLKTIAQTLRHMVQTLHRMPERCDPYIYFRRVRPYIHGWKDHPLLPEGLVYEGVEAYGGRPQRFRGETGAQSTIVPVMDAALGIEHADDPLRPYLMEMRTYMPPEHAAFLQSVERGASVRRAVLQYHGDHAELREHYNAAVTELAAFRSLHLDYANQYIHRQSQSSPMNPSQVGTGGTPFMAYLKKHRDETLTHVLP